MAGIITKRNENAVAFGEVGFASLNVELWFPAKINLSESNVNMKAFVNRLTSPLKGLLSNKGALCLRKCAFHLNSAQPRGLMPAMRMLARFSTLRHRLAKDGAKGSAAIEFAFVAPVFFAMMLGILQLGTMIFAQFALQNAVTEAARQVRVGAAQSIAYGSQAKCSGGAGGSGRAGAYASSQEWFHDQVCCGVSALMNCSNLFVNVSSSSAGFASSGFASTLGANSMYSNVTNAYSPGNSCDVVLVRATYAWPIWFPGIAQLLNLQVGSHTSNSNNYLVNMTGTTNGDPLHFLSGTSAFRNEPFSNGIGGC
jgi:Flp pilus assembly protein TadG